MKLGAFSTSLAVSNIKDSQAFYQSLGFSVVGGEIEQNWLIMRNGATTLGLFQGMFEDNIMTFNPGWNEQAQEVEGYTDIREIQKHLQAQGIALVTEVEEGSSGPGSFMLKDPDGNQILIDQHVG